MKLTEGLTVAALGMGIVFLLLLTLVAFIKLQHLVLKPKSKNSNAPLESPKEHSVPTVPAKSSSSDQSELVATITAAICMMTGQPNTAFVIKSIKRKTASPWRHYTK